MNYRELGEMVEWMRENGVIHMSHDGTVLTLAEVAPIVYSEPEDTVNPAEEEDDGFTTPQARIRNRAQLRKDNAGMDKTT